MTDADGQPSDPNTVVVSSVNASPVADAGVDQGALVGRSIISRKTLRLFWEKPEYGDAEQSLKAWFKEASDADWASPAAIKAAFSLR